MKKVTKTETFETEYYVTDDGQEFNTEDEAEKHEARKLIGHIKEYKISGTCAIIYIVNSIADAILLQNAYETYMRYKDSVEFDLESAKFPLVVGLVSDDWDEYLFVLSDNDVSMLKEIVLAV